MLSHFKTLDRDHAQNEKTTLGHSVEHCFHSTRVPLKLEWTIEGMFQKEGFSDI